MKENQSKGLILSSVFTALGASLCCITPVLALVAGSTSAASGLTWMEPLRPYFIGFTVLVLGFAWYQRLRPAGASNEECGCEVPDTGKPFLQSKKFLGLVTVFAVLMLFFPSYAHIFYPETTQPTIVSAVSNVRKVHFDIEGMTCQGCAEHIKLAVGAKEGIVAVESSYEQGDATVSYDASLVSLDSLRAAINATGYKVTGIQEMTNPDS